jgi:hypothetical protein
VENTRKEVRRDVEEAEMGGTERIEVEKKVRRGNGKRSGEWEK